MVGIMNKKTLSNLMSIEKRKFGAAIEIYKNLGSFARVNHSENSYKRARQESESSQRLAGMDGATSVKKERVDAVGFDDPLNESDLQYAILPDGGGFQDICAVEIKEEYISEDDTQVQPANQQAEFSQETEEPTLKGIFDLLKTLSQRMKTMETRVANIENAVRENCINYQLTAQNQLMRENLTITKQILKSTKHLLGDDMDEVEINVATRLPLATMADILDLEEHLKEPGFENSMKIYLTKIKGTSTIQDMFRQLIEDKLVEEFNWDGRTGKRALRSLTLFNKILPDVYRSLTSKDLEKNFRKCVELSHNRYKQRKYSDRRKLSVLAPDQVAQMKPHEEENIDSSSCP